MTNLELRDHMNAEHGYTIPTDKDVSCWLFVLKNEHRDKHAAQSPGHTHEGEGGTQQEP